MRIFQSFVVVCLTALVFGASPVWAQTEMDNGMSAFHAEKWDDAIANFSAVMKKDPQNTLAMAYMLHAYFRKKDISAIINQIEQQATSKNDAASQAQLGMAYFLKGMIQPAVLEEALTEFKNAVKDDSQCSMAYSGMGMVYFQKRTMPRSKAFFVKALRINPHDIMALDRLGNIMLVDEKKPTEALDLFQRIVAELPSYPDGHYFSGSALYDLKRYEEAIPFLAKCRELDPKGITQGFDAATLLGDCFMKLNRFTEATEAFEVALKMEPTSEYAKIRAKKARDGVSTVIPK